MNMQIDDGGLGSQLADSLAGEFLAYSEKLADLTRRINEHCVLVDATIAQINAERQLYGLD